MYQPKHKDKNNANNSKRRIMDIPSVRDSSDFFSNPFVRKIPRHKEITLQKMGDSMPSIIDRQRKEDIEFAKDLDNSYQYKLFNTLRFARDKPAIDIPIVDNSINWNAARKPLDDPNLDPPSESQTSSISVNKQSSVAEVIQRNPYHEWEKILAKYGWHGWNWPWSAKQILSKPYDHEQAMCDWPPNIDPDIVPQLNTRPTKSSELFKYLQERQEQRLQKEGEREKESTKQPKVKDYHRRIHEEKMIEYVARTNECNATQLQVRNITASPELFKYLEERQTEREDEEEKNKDVTISMYTATLDEPRDNAWKWPWIFAKKVEDENEEIDEKELRTTRVTASKDIFKYLAEQQQKERDAERAKAEMTAKDVSESVETEVKVSKWKWPWLKNNESSDDDDGIKIESLQKRKVTVSKELFEYLQTQKKQWELEEKSGDENVYKPSMERKTGPNEDEDVIQQIQSKLPSSCNVAPNFAQMEQPKPPQSIELSPFGNNDKIDNVKKKKPIKKRQKTLIIMLVVCFCVTLMIVGGVVFMVLSRKGKDQKSKDVNEDSKVGNLRLLLGELKKSEMEEIFVESMF